MIALDLFCKAGGASMGLSRAGYDVIGIDIEPQPNYPFEFIQMEAIEFLENFGDLVEGPASLIWASPPCQAYINGGNTRNPDAPKLIGKIRERLVPLGCPWIIENVEGAEKRGPMRVDAMLCGSHFDLGVRRHRIFEASFPLPTPPECNHSKPIVGVYGNPHGKRGAWPSMLPSTHESWSEAMGIGWMTSRELTQAVPPAYSEFLARAVPR